MGCPLNRGRSAKAQTVDADKLTMNASEPQVSPADSDSYPRGKNLKK
jgi:hypothetical protein